jgi:propanediol dehydratase small subunit
MITLNDNEANTVVCALRVAAAAYTIDAEVMRKHGHDKMARQFERQENDAKELADKIEAA